VCAVSYLNTVPLVWGMLHSPDPELRQTFDLRFALPAACADQLASGDADIGIVPVIEIARQKLQYFRSTGIACRGPVRSILLISKVPFARIKTLAADAASRTSVMLARVILAEKYGVEPSILPHPADLAAMLGDADAALVIGDPALLLDPKTLPFETLDLGAEWTALTTLPMVFAVWGGRKEAIQPRYERLFAASCRYGLDHIEDMVQAEAPPRGVSLDLARRYFTEHIVYELGPRDHAGMELYLKMATAIDIKMATALETKTGVPVSGVPA
jgi:chorismate dehydratase